MNTKLRNIMILCMAAVMLLSCFTGSAFAAEQDASSAEAEPALTRVADHLYEATYSTDFDWGDTVTPDMSGFACAGVQNGRYRGRNYDWTYADTDLCIIRTTVTENRPHASVGVADLSFLHPEDGSLNYAKFPFVTVDGINDAGLCVQVNVMPFGENGLLTHTETTEDDLPGSRVVRYLLDYADSVETAIALLSGKDIHSEMSANEELHWMISGPATGTDSTIITVVVEVFPDGLHVTDHFVDGKPIMTNFNVSNFDGSPESIGIGFGYERWQILDEYYDQANCVMGTFDLMEKVYFSKYYDLYGDRFWYSEYGGIDLLKYSDAETLKGILGEEKFNYYMETYGGIYYYPDLWDGETALHGDASRAGVLADAVRAITESYNAQNDTDGSLWITIHTSVYDLENKTLDIQVRESQDHFRFSIG